MKKFLPHIQHTFSLALALFCSFSVVPYPTSQTFYDTLDPPYSELIDPDETIEQDPPLPADPTEEELYEFDTPLIIKALNPGYTIDGKSDVGEFIELQNLTDAPLVLAGYSLEYTNSSGKTTTLYTFPKGSYMTGKHILLRYNGSPASERNLSDDVYKGNGIAMKAGTLALVFNEETMDSVCWNQGDDCFPELKKDGKNLPGDILVRNLVEGVFEMKKVADYPPHYNPALPGLQIDSTTDDSTDDPAEEETNKTPQCRDLEFSEILSYYAEDKSEQFIEFFNPTSTEIILDGCLIGYKNKTYPLSGQVGSGAYYAFYPGDLFALTKNPTKPLTLTIIDADDAVVDDITYGNGQKKSTAYARVFDEANAESWQITYAPTPNSENIYQKFRSCEEGKIINEATGNCIKVTTLKSATSKTASGSTLAPCPAGKYRNPLTGRCKNIESGTSSTLKPCAEGYERNPETNRCRKIASTKSNDGADYALVPNTRSDNTVFIGIGIVTIIVALGLSYVILQFRHEIARAARKTGQRINRIRQNLFSGKIGRHRHK